MNTRQHNYSEIAQKTKNAFQIFSKRLLAKKILQVLSENKMNTTITSPQIVLEFNEPLSSGINEITMDQNEGFSKTMHTNHKQAISSFSRDVSVTKITQLKYGDYVIIDIQILKDQCRIYSNLQFVKVFNIKEVPSNIFSLRKSAFQIQCPALHFKEDGEKISSRSMICLKNVFTGYFMHLSTQVSKGKQFGYQIKLKPDLQSSGLFKFNQGEGERDNITTDLQTSIASYYRPDLKISIGEENLLGKLDRFLIGSYSQLYFKLTKLENTTSLVSNPFYYIKCVQVNKNLQIQEPNLEKFTIKKQIRQLYIEQTFVNDKSGVINQDSNSYKCEFLQLTPIRQSNTIRISLMKDLDLCQIWQIERIQQKQQEFQCRVKNVISNQQLGCNELYRKNYLQFKKQQNNYVIYNEQNEILTAVYDSQTQSYMLSYKQQNNLQNQSSINKMFNYKFAIQPLEDKFKDSLYYLIEINELLKYNYPFLQKWGFHYEDRIERIKYSLIHLKKDIRLMSKKIIQINLALDKLMCLLKKEQSNLSYIQNIVKQLKLLELLIIYCQIIKIKIGKPSQVHEKDIYKFASSYLKTTLFKLFDLIFLLTSHNQLCSQVIIQNNIIFNQLLKDYNDPIGSIIEQAITNLCILTNKTVQEEDVIFSWTAHVEPISDPQLFQIQKQYIDIISQVVIDPNDIGIHPYQYKIKEQLIGNRKKKIIPKFALTSEKIIGVNQPLIIFQYDSFPINLKEKQNGFKALNTAFQLRYLFNNRKNIDKYKQQIAYISSMLKLLRNLCKQKNKKLSKIMEDYGLTVQYLHCVFKNTQISWEIITKFLDLYCVMYLVQDPFLPFEKRQVKCYSWHQISHFNFSQKTGILFCQSTLQNLALQKYRVFQQNIQPIFDKYFDDLQRWEQSELQSSKIEGFYNIVSILYQIINYGYLNYKHIQRYVYFILKFSDVILKKQLRNERRQKMINRVVPILIIAEQISTIVQGMNLLQLIHHNFKTSKLTSNQYLRSVFTEALTFKSALRCKTITMIKRNTTFNFKENNSSSRKPTQKIQISNNELDSFIIQYAIKKIAQNKCTMNNDALKSLLKLLQIISQRGQRIISFLNQIFILDSQAESLYLQYSGIATAQLASEESERRLLNVMKVKELVDKITEENLQTEDQGRKRQKILELKNVLMKIIKKLQWIKNKDYNTFRICQTLFRKLKLHCILIEIIKFSDKDYYQSLIHQIIIFLLLFIHEHPENLQAMAPYFGLFTKKYSFSKLPLLLPPLFAKNSNKEECFWLVYRNVDKKMDENQKQILFQCIYNICQICPPEVLQNIKGQVVYNIITNSKFDEYVKGTIQSPNFINIICFIGKSSCKIAQRIKESISKTTLYEGLVNGSKSFILKSIYLKLYHFLYISKSNEIDDLQCEELIDKFFLAQLKHLPSSCHSRASTKLEELKQMNSSSKIKNESRTQMQAIISGYSKLMMQGSESVATSQQEHYFLFLLNIQNQNELSLLMCLKQMLIKYQVKNIQPLASYIFQLINFMEKLFLTKQKIYQSRILNKLYQISTVMQQKYNRAHRRQTTISFQSANEKVWLFYGNFVNILSRERISFHKLLQCGKVSAYEIEQFRNGQNSQKLILQSEFLHFIHNLIGSINDRETAYQLTSQAAIKQFFIIYSEKGTHKINIIKFISKLIEILQNKKSLKVCEVKKKEEGKEGESELVEQNHINYGLLKKQLSNLSKVFQIDLVHFMTDRIKQAFKQTCKQCQSNLSSNNCIQVHLKNTQYSIMNFMVSQMMKKTKLTNYQAISTNNWQQYLAFLFNQMIERPSFSVVSILASIYDCIQQSSSIFPIYVQSLNMFIIRWNNLTQTHKMMYQREIYSISKEINSLASKIVSNPFLPIDQRTQLQSMLAHYLISIFDSYMSDPNFYWANQCQISLSLILNIQTNYSIISTILSQSELFINCFQQLLTQTLKNGILNTNKQSQQAITIVNTILRLLKKFRAKQLISELEPILIHLPYKMMIQAFDQNYSYIEGKSLMGVCSQQFSCSQQFCNEDQLTSHDKYILEVITNILFIIHIASHILVSSNIIKDAQPKNKEVLLNYNQNKTTLNHTNSSYTKYWQLVRTIEMNADGQKSIFYFSLPFANQTYNTYIQKQVQEQLMSISKQKYFYNLYNLSWYVQKKYQQTRTIWNKFGWCKTVIYNSQFIHLVFVVYLAVINFDMIFYNINVPSALKYTFNTAIILIKLILFSIQCSSMYYKQRLLRNVQYDRNITVYRITSFIISLLAIVSYFIQYNIEQFYPITFILQLCRIKMVKKVCFMLASAAHQMLYILLFLQSILFACSIIIYDRQSGTNRSMSLINIFINLSEELILIQFLPIDIQYSQQHYVLVKKIPQFIPLLVVTIMSIQAVVLAKIVVQFISMAKKQKQKYQVCDVCGYSKHHLESLGKKYANHVSFQHNIWNYIQFFIHIRNKTEKEVEECRFNELVSKQDFKFLKI